MISVAQQALLERWLPGASIVRDHSWGLVGTTVLELDWNGGRYIAKAGDAADHHIARELRAHRSWLDPWTSRGRAPALVHGSDEAKLLVTEYLPGSLVQDGPAEFRADTYRQAGSLLALLHRQSATPDGDFEGRATEKMLAWLDKPNRIAPATVARIRELAQSWPAPPATLVPTHGDWQPRNWLVHEGAVRVIDFGRADLRPAFTDFVRLAGQQFLVDPALEAAFLAGYGGDPREPEQWRRAQLREAVGTAAWAFQVGDESFEAQGHRMIADALAAFG